MFALSDGEEIMTLAFFVLIYYRTVTDRQTDGRTDISAVDVCTTAKIYGVKFYSMDLVNDEVRKLRTIRNVTSATKAS